MRCFSARFSGSQFCGFPFPRKITDSSDTRYTSVTLLDGLARKHGHDAFVVKGHQKTSAVKFEWDLAWFSHLVLGGGRNCQT